MTGPQLERWRSGGYLPPNMRAGLGRGAGSRSETVAGVTDYAEALACLSVQGRSMHHVLLTLFMGGVVQPGQCPAGDLLRETYETAIRRAFRKEIQQRDKALNRVTAHLAASYKDRTQAKDNAFKEAQALARRRADKARTLETTGASLSGTAPRTPEELQSEGGQALLAAARQIPDLEPDDVYQRFGEIWFKDLAPMDAGIWAQPDCPVCDSRTANFATSPDGRRDILRSASFAELNRARAIGGAVCMMIAHIREAFLRSPDDTALRHDVALCSNTAFRVFLREPLMIDLRSPGSIVPCTLFFLSDCRWISSGAALLTQVAVNHMPSGGRDTALPAAAADALVEIAGRSGILRLFENGAAMLLMADGLTESAKVVKSHDAHAG